jgi:hypothetical protein
MARIVLVSAAVVVVSASPLVAQTHTPTPFLPESTIELSPGISFTRGVMRTGKRGVLQSVRVATVWPQDPSVRLRSVLSNDLVVGREPVTAMAERTSVAGLLAMVATNGDLSTEGRVDAYAAPQSMAVSGGELLVAPACARPTFGIDSAGAARIGHVRVHVTLSKIGHKARHRIDRVNTQRDDASVVLYTSRFAASTQTAPGGVEVILSMPDILRPNGVQEVTVSEVRAGAGDSALGPGMAVLSVNGPHGRWVSQLQPGQSMTLETTVVHAVDSRCGGTIEAEPGWGDVVEALGGNYFTLRDGAIAAPSRLAYPQGSQRHPRTNVGITADGRVLMVTVDGRQRGYSRGMRLGEMGQLLASLGAITAINLDGGGSTVMARRSLRTGGFTVVNRPSDGLERQATQALVAYQATPGS